MKRLLVVVVALALTAGCGSRTKHDPTPSALASARSSKPSSPPRDASEDVFVDLMRKNVPTADALTDAGLLRLGHNICDDVQVGDADSTLRSLKTLLNLGIPARDAGTSMVYISVLCPDKADALSMERLLQEHPELAG